MTIRTCLVCSLAGAAILPKTVVMLKILMIIAFFTVIAVVTVVQQGRDTSQSVEMVFHFKEVNFLRNIIISTVFIPQ